MVDLDLRRLIGRLNTYSRRALETAAGLAVSRGHYEVSIEHLLSVFIEDSQHDLQTACRHFEVDPANLKRKLQSVLESVRGGNQGRPVFSPILIEWISDAWLISSVELGLDQVRSGSLFATIFSRPNRFGDERWLSVLGGVSYETFKKQFDSTIAGSQETTAAVTAAALGVRPERPSVDELVEAIRPILSAHFKPALLARMQIVPFYPLVGAPLGKIVRLKLNKVGKRLRENQKMAFSYSDDVVNAIAARCTEVETGARNIDHIVNRTILPELATELLSNMGEDGKAYGAVSIGLAEDGRFAFALS